MVEFLLSLLPIAVLLVCLLVISLPAKYSSAIAFAVAAVEFVFWFRPGALGMGITLSKGAVMALFVGLIALGAMLLYNLVDISGGFEVINGFLSRVFKDEFALFIMITWAFSAFLQGIAGYGLPAVIATTILVKSGFDVAKSAAASLLGPSWAITFGSMGSSIFAIDLVTDSPVKDTLISMSHFGSVGMVCCGLGVCFIYGGFKFLAQGLKYIIPAWLVMTAALVAMAHMEMVSVIGFVTGMIGVAVMILTHRIFSRKQRKSSAAQPAEVREQTTCHAADGRSPELCNSPELCDSPEFCDSPKLRANNGRLLDSVLPYIMVIVMSIGFFLLKPSLELSFSFPGYESAGGVMVEAEEDYVTFNILKYPFSIIVIATAISVVYYLKIGLLKKGDIKTIAKTTVNKIKSTEITLLLLLCTASIMMDSGMTTILSEAIVELAGRGYAFMSSVIGVLGAFITGSNTNANILFGSLQETAAISLGMAPAIICAVQSVSASVGGAIGPTTTALVAAAAEKSGKEAEIYRHTLAPTVITAAVLGALALLAV